MTQIHWYDMYGFRRPAISYRGARRNKSRGERKSLTFKYKRIIIGMTRSEYDRMRWKALMDKRNEQNKSA